MIPRTSSPTTTEPTISDQGVSAFILRGSDVLTPDTTTDFQLGFNKDRTRYNAHGRYVNVVQISSICEVRGIDESWHSDMGQRG